MSKYDRLRDFLSANGGEPITLTFSQVKVLIPDIAPSHATDNRWWNNDDPSHSHCRSWGDAGYEAHPALAHRRVTFRPKLPSTAR
jgi:hypothetical protein